jgi:hypothetical protein
MMILTPNMTTYTWSLTPGMRKRAVERRRTIRAVEVWPCLIPAQKDTSSAHKPIFMEKIHGYTICTVETTAKQFLTMNKKVSLLRRKILCQKHCCRPESGSGSRSGRIGINVQALDAYPDPYSNLDLSGKNL